VTPAAARQRERHRAGSAIGATASSRRWTVTTEETGIRDDLVDACPMARLVYLALLRVDQPATAARLETAALSPRQSVLDGLHALQERGIVERAENECEPGRPRYRLADSRDS